MKDVTVPALERREGGVEKCYLYLGLSFQSLLNAPTSWEALENAEGFAGTQQAGVRAKQSLMCQTVPFTENGPAQNTTRTPMGNRSSSRRKQEARSWKASSTLKHTHY